LLFVGPVAYPGTWRIKASSIRGGENYSPVGILKWNFFKLNLHFKTSDYGKKNVIGKKEMMEQAQHRRSYRINCFFEKLRPSNAKPQIHTWWRYFKCCLPRSGFRQIEKTGEPCVTFRSALRKFGEFCEV